MAKPEQNPKERRAWDREKDEPAVRFKAFQDFLKLGASRSLRKAAQKQRKGSAHYGPWAKEHRWLERAQAYDLWVAEKTEPFRVKAVQKAVRERAIETESELTKELRAEYELFETGKTLAAEMLQVGRAGLRFPLHEESRTTTELDKGKTIVITNIVTATDISKHAMAGKLAAEGLSLLFKMSREKIAKLVGSLPADQPVVEHRGTDGLTPEQAEMVNRKLAASFEEFKAKVDEYQSHPLHTQGSRPTA